MFGRQSRVRWLVTWLLIALFGCLVLLFGVLVTGGLLPASSWASVLGTAVVIIGTVFQLVTYLQRRESIDGPVNSRQLAKARDLLADRVTVQWRDEEEIRGLGYPKPMPVCWTARSGPVADHPRSAAPDGLVFAGRSDRIDELVEQFNALSCRRLVILGGSGSGKTTLALQLLLDLLKDRASAEPVPVLLTLAGWDLKTHRRFKDWLAARLDEDYPELRTINVKMPRALVDRDLVMPVLDGLDELPEEYRPRVITALNTYLGQARPVVLTSRSEDFDAAVAAGDQLTAAVVIEPVPLTPTDAADYLDNCLPPTAGDPWTDVLKALRDGHDAAKPLAEVCQKPLGLWLLRTVYITGGGIQHPTPSDESMITGAVPEKRRDSGGDPKSLVTNRKEYPDAAAIENHLLKELIPAVIEARPRSDDPTYRLRPRHEWDPRDVRRWLSFLAHDLRNQPENTTDFYWWKLSGAALRPRAAITVGLIAGLAGALGLPFPMDLGFGLISAFAVAFLVCEWLPLPTDPKKGLVGGLFGRLLCKWLPLPTDPKKGLVGGLFGGLLSALVALTVFPAGVGSFLALAPGLSLAVAPLGRFRAGLAGAFAGGLVAAFSRHATIVHQIGATIGPIASLVNGFGIGLVTGFAVGLSKRDRPARGLRWSPIGLMWGLASGLVLGFVVWIQVGALSGLVVGLASVIIAGWAGGFVDDMPTELAKATSPRVVLVRDRATFRSSCLGIGLAVGLVTGLWAGFTSEPPDGFRVGLGVGLANLTVVGLVFGFLRASWGSFTLARWWLAASRRLPWRLLAFLDDAYRLGLLRIVGPAYRFRHDKLQDHLTAPVAPKSVRDRIWVRASREH